MTAPDALVVVDEPERHRFAAYEDGVLVARAHYRRGPGRITFTHTVVEPDHEGRGVGSALARFALQDARDERLEVLPACPFIRSWIVRHPEFVALVPVSQRQAYGLSEPT